MRRLCLTLASLAILFFTFSPLIAHGQFDSRCFTETQCKNQQGFAPDEGDFKEFFYDGKDAQASCGVAANEGKNAVGERMGFCLASGEATTKISFGGKRNFTDIGDFIKYAYEYGMWIAGILAVSVIIAAGFGWVMSGGNADSISSAKKKIAGSLTGLILLSLSYVILNTINPYLVELRLPKTWMINTAVIAPPFCAELEDGKLAYLGPDKAAISDEEKKIILSQAESLGYSISSKAGAPKTLTAADLKAMEIINASTTLSFTEKIVIINEIKKKATESTTNEKNSPLCGHRYLVEGTLGQSCLGDICGASSVCLPFTEPPDKTQAVSQGEFTMGADELQRQSACWSGDIVIYYKADNLLQTIITKGSDNLVGKLEEDDDDHWFQDSASTSALDNEIWLYSACKFTPNSTNIGAEGLLKTFGERVIVTDESNESYIESTPIILIINRPGNLREYVVRYKISAEDIGALKTRCRLTGGATNQASGELVGIVIKNQLNGNWENNDSLIYTYKDADGKGSAGIWQSQNYEDSNFDIDYFSPKGYIPLGDIDGSKGKGLYLDFNLPPEVFAQIGAARLDSFGN